MSPEATLGALGLRQIVIAALAREGITTERQLREAEHDALSSIPGIGRSNLAHIYHVLNGKNSDAIHQIDSTISQLQMRQKRYQDRLSRINQELRALNDKRTLLVEEV